MYLRDVHCVGIASPFESAAAHLPLTENAAGSVWPSSTFSVLSVKASHTLTDVSTEPETIPLSSLENVTDVT